MHDVTRSIRSTILLLPALAITAAGCAAEVVPVGYAEADLDYVAAQPDPPDTDIPSCWWVPEDRPELCDVTPSCIPIQPPTGTSPPPRRPPTTPPVVTAPTTPPTPPPTTPPTYTITTTTASTTLGTSTSTTITTPPTSPPPASSPFGGPTDFAGPPMCPPTDGIVSCPQCMQRSPLDPRVLTFDIPQLSPYVLLSNGSASWQVKDMLIPRSGGLGEVTVDLDLADVVDQSGDIDLDAGLYVFVTREYESGPYPYWNWFYCPSVGGECVVLESE